MKGIVKKMIAACLVAAAAGVLADTGEESRPSDIVSVKLYQNQATIVRQTRLRLAKGVNTVILGNLPPLLYDWSVRGSLPENFGGKILSLEVEKKALVQKRQKSIVAIENKLERLRERDQVHVDELKNIAGQEKFLNSVMEFTSGNVSKELATRIPQVGLWNDTLQYLAKKTSDLLREKRRIGKEREKIGKEIQKWEFELSQIAGSGYFRNYQTLNKALLDNRSAMNIQQYADSTGLYGEKRKIFLNPTENLEIEKRLIVSIQSPETVETTITFSYVIPQTKWQMRYDVRAGYRTKGVKMVVYGDIYQKTGENWEGIRLALSTGRPVSSITPPSLTPWYIDIIMPGRLEGEERSKDDETGRAYKKGVAPPLQEQLAQEEDQVTVREEGIYFEISLPALQTVASTSKYQKKLIREYDLGGGREIEFFYEAIPEKANSAYMKALVKNMTDLPWLEGETQVFLENEFMGKITMPFTPPGKECELTLGIEPRVIVKKELVKKFEDTAGILGGKRKIRYHYKLTLENQLKKRESIMVYDVFPVSLNDKIRIDVENLSLPLPADEEFKKTTRYAQGTRRWKLVMEPGAKQEITYDVVVTFDRDTAVRGLR
ncbi:MAG: DUF4139 domain-containing protein [Spirochaetes bacterium]|nr:DUF4139 domain-containing protein [Spirochaetota bacterium]